MREYLPPGLSVLEGSTATVDGVLYAAVGSDDFAALGGAEQLNGFDGAASECEGKRLVVCSRSEPNLAELRRRLSWLRPTPLGLRTSVGFGDRLGIATPGHVAAMRRHGAGISPVFAQQSIREMERTHRSPRQVVDDATWAVFCSGWREPFGTDADHLKTEDDVRRCLALGYTFWTIDPGDYVDATADATSPDRLQQQLLALPWAELDDTPERCLRRYRDAAFEIEGERLVMHAVSLARAAVKYGGAIAHARKLVSLIQSTLDAGSWELEIAVDETESVTTHLEHIYMLLEFQRLGLRVTSFAPRYVGEFEKGVDYLGDPGTFERHFGMHAAIARQLGPYKLSLHSGSDKFSIFAPAACQTRGLVHLKTAGTSYVEALRTLATLDVALFREIYAFAREQFETARPGYHISGRVERTPAPEAVADADLPELLDEFDARQVLHVTYGQVLTAREAAGRLRFRDRLVGALQAVPQAYTARLEQHFARHLASFAAQAR